MHARLFFRVIFCGMAMVVVVDRRGIIFMFCRRMPWNINDRIFDKEILKNTASLPTILR